MRKVAYQRLSNDLFYPKMLDGKLPTVHSYRVVAHLLFLQRVSLVLVKQRLVTSLSVVNIEQILQALILLRHLKDTYAQPTVSLTRVRCHLTRLTHAYS